MLFDTKLNLLIINLLLFLGIITGCSSQSEPKTDIDKPETSVISEETNTKNIVDQVDVVENLETLATNTEESVVNEDFETALSIAEGGDIIATTANNRDKQQLAISKWEDAISLWKSISETSSEFLEAKDYIKVYQQKIIDTKKNYISNVSSSSNKVSSSSNKVSSSSNNSSALDQSNTYRIIGNIRLIGDIGHHSNFCWGRGGYDDLTSGKRITVRDDKGTIIATGKLEQGKRPKNHQKDLFSSYTCNFKFEITQIPKRNFYSINLGKRGEMNYSFAELEERNWVLELSIG